MHLGDILDIIVGDIEGDLGSNSGWGVGDWGVEEEESGVDDIRIDDGQPSKCFPFFVHLLLRILL